MTTFTRTLPGVYDRTTDLWTTPVVTTITGSASQVRGNPTVYEALSLMESSAPTLLFTPDLYDLRAMTDDFVRPGDTTVWNGRPFTVRDVFVVAPDGIVIISRIVVSN